MTINSTTPMKWANKSLEKLKLPKLLEENIGNMNSQYLLKKLNPQFKDLPQRKLQAPMALPVNSIKYLGNKIITILY